MTKITSLGIEQIIGGNQITAAGLQIELVSMGFNAGGDPTADFVVNLVDKKGISLAQIANLKNFCVGDTATILDLNRAFDITISA